MKYKEWGAFLLLGTIWGSSFLWIKLAVQEVDPLTLVAFRLLFGIIGLSAALLFIRPRWPKQPTLWASLTLFGLLNTTIPYLLITWGENHIDSAVAAILNSTTPLFALLAAHFFIQGEKITFYKLSGLLVGLAGIILLVWRDNPGRLFNNLAGQAAVLMASLLYGACSVFARRNFKDLDPAIQAFIPLLGSDAALWLIILARDSKAWLPLLPITWLAMTWLGIMGIAAAFLLYFYLIHAIGPMRATLVTYLFPVVGVILGVIFLGERLDWNLTAGTAFVILSIALINRKKTGAYATVEAS